MSAKMLDAVTKKIAEIKDFCGIELTSHDLEVKRRRGHITFIVDMVTNVHNMEIYKMEKLYAFGIIAKIEPAGHNRIMVHFK